MFRHTSAITLVELAALGLAVALGATAVHADTITVCWDGSGDYRTIQEGIDVASDGDEVVVCDGTYTGDGNKNLDFHGKAITVRSQNGPDNCIIDCENDGRGFYFHSGETPASVVHGFTIMNGAVEYCGGGLYCHSSSPTIHHCRFTANTAGFGGGGLSATDDSNAVIINCTFTANAAPYGGGVDVPSPGHATVTDCVIMNNTATEGGGGIVSGDATISGCAITGNTAGDRGGGMYIGGDLTITGCTISDNVAEGPYGRGGGIACYWADATITDCTLLRNIATDAGGAVFCWDSRLSLIQCAMTGNDDGAVACVGSQTSCTIAASLIANNVTDSNGAGVYCADISSLTVVNTTIAGNQAGGEGGAIKCIAADRVMLGNCAITGNAAETGGALFFHLDCAVTVANCTLAGNAAANGQAIACASFGPPNHLEIVNSILWNSGDEVYNPSDSTIAMMYSDVTGGWPGIGNIDADPLFVDPDNEDFHLSPGSPCIDAGCNWAVPPDTADLDEDGDTSEYTPLDLDGEGRFFDDPDTADTGCGCPPIVDMGAYEFGDAGSQPCPGDLDCDRVVGHSDLGIFLRAWHISDEGDLNCDGETDHADLGILLGHWGEGCP